MKEVFTARGRSGDCVLGDAFGVGKFGIVGIPPDLKFNVRIQAFEEIFEFDGFLGKDTHGFFVYLIVRVVKGRFQIVKPPRAHARGFSLC